MYCTANRFVYHVLMTTWTPATMGRKGGKRRTKKKLAAVTKTLLDWHAQQRAKRDQLLLKLK